MNTAKGKASTIGLLLITMATAIVYAADRHEPALSPAQTAIISQQIAALKAPADRHVAESWSNSKKIAELICRPAAFSVLKRQVKGVDRVFLGTGAPKSLALESNRRLTGNGEFRTTNGWQDFTFTCNIDPATAKVTSFQPTLLAPAGH